MLTLYMDQQEAYDEETNTFVKSGGYEIQLEHSLVSLSKWESKWEKPFLGKQDKVNEEVTDYILCMVTSPEIPENFLKSLQQEHYSLINKYIEAGMTATWFTEHPGQPKSREVITAELIYYWMIAFNIPFECQHWHLNRLLTLIKVCNEKNTPPKKMGRKELMQRQRQLNAQRRQEMGTRG